MRNHIECPEENAQFILNRINLKVVMYFLVSALSTRIESA